MKSFSPSALAEVAEPEVAVAVLPDVPGTLPFTVLDDTSTPPSLTLAVTEYGLLVVEAEAALLISLVVLMAISSR
jgi:hypothetical protein